MKTIIYIALMVSLLGTSSQAAQINPKDSINYPMVGKPCPDFYFNELINGTQKTLSLKDLKGQYFVLDFWSRWCSTCIASFPKVNALNEKMKGKARIILVGLADPYSRPLFHKVNEKWNLKLACAFDTTTFRNFGIKGLPAMVWVDSKGIVQAITNGEPLNVANLEKFANGIPLNLGQKPNAKEQEIQSQYYNYNQPFLTGGNGGNDTTFLMRSILTKWDKRSPKDLWYDYFKTAKGKPNEVFVSGITLSWLYRMAYGDTLSVYPSDQPNDYGKRWFKPILELQDTSRFNFKFDSGEGLYTYNLIVNDRKISKPELQAIMQKDLLNYFGYTVSVENRKMPYWKLVKGAGYEKLKTKGSSVSYSSDGFTYITYKNYDLSLIIQTLAAVFPVGAPFVNESDIPWKIDLSIHAVLTDFKDFKAALSKNGLELIKSEKYMKVIVIKEPEAPQFKAAVK